MKQLNTFILGKKHRPSRSRAIAYLLVMFMSYFIFAKPVAAATPNQQVAMSESSHSSSHGTDGQTDDGCESCADLEIDDFLIAPMHFAFTSPPLIYVRHDMTLSWPAFSRAVDEPPELT